MRMTGNVVPIKLSSFKNLLSFFSKINYQKTNRKELEK